LPRSVLDGLPRLAEHAFLVTAREMVFSGFSLELYGVDERPAAYWYAARLLSADRDVIDALVLAVPEGEVVFLHDAKLMQKNEGIEREELIFQRSFVDALSSICRGLFMVRP
jgi:hypothetical protein